MEGGDLAGVRLKGTLLGSEGPKFRICNLKGQLGELPKLEWKHFFHNFFKIRF